MKRTEASGSGQASAETLILERAVGFYSSQRRSQRENGLQWEPSRRNPHRPGDFSTPPELIGSPASFVLFVSFCGSNSISRHESAFGVVCGGAGTPRPARAVAGRARCPHRAATLRRHRSSQGKGMDSCFQGEFFRRGALLRVHGRGFGSKVCCAPPAKAHVVED